jgi:hypothetical protein
MLYSTAGITIGANRTDENDLTLNIHVSINKHPKVGL